MKINKIEHSNVRHAIKKMYKKFGGANNVIMLNVFNAMKQHILEN